MGAAAQVHELVGVAVCGDHSAGGPRGRVVRLAVENLDLVGVRSEQLIGGGTIHLGTDERLTGGHDRAHLGLDRREVLVGERPRPTRLIDAQVEVVIEAVSDGRPDRERRFRVQPQHRLGQHVGGRVAQHLEPLFRRPKHQRHRCAVGQRPVQVELFAVGHGDERVFRCSPPQRRSKIGAGCAGGQLPGLPVGQHHGDCRAFAVHVARVCPVTAAHRDSFLVSTLRMPVICDVPSAALHRAQAIGRLTRRSG